MGLSVMSSIVCFLKFEYESLIFSLIDMCSSDCSNMPIAVFCASGYDDQTQFSMFEQKSEHVLNFHLKSRWTFGGPSGLKKLWNKSLFTCLSSNWKHWGTALESWIKPYPPVWVFKVNMPPIQFTSRHKVPQLDYMTYKGVLKRCLMTRVHTFDY